MGALLVARWAVRALKARRYPLSGRRVFITGGSRGLGLVLARELAAQGARVAICGRDADALCDAVAEFEAKGLPLIAVTCDVGSRRQVEEAVQEVTVRLGGIEALINNAGLIQVGPSHTQRLSDYEAEMQVHFWGPLYTTLAVLPQMRGRGGGRIVNIASIGGKLSVPHLLPYSASKFALVGLSEGLTAELEQEGIRVTTVCPGLMRTGSPRNVTVKGHHRAEYTWFKVADSVPPLAMSAERAARRIVAAMQRGDPEVFLSAFARLATAFHGVFPGTTARVLSATNRLLPRGEGPERMESRTGAESGTAVSESALTALTQRAAERNNQT